MFNLQTIGAFFGALMLVSCGGEECDTGLSLDEAGECVEVTITTTSETGTTATTVTETGGTTTSTETGTTTTGGTTTTSTTGTTSTSTTGA